mgnify:CR=1 FL=1
MNRFLIRMTLIIVALLQYSVTVFAGPLDDYYLQQFGGQDSIQSGSALQKAILLPASASDEMPRCGTPLKHKLRLDWDKLESTTQKTLAKTVALLPSWVGNQTSESKFNLPGGRFLIHYTTTGADAPPLTDADTNGVPDWVETVAQTFENVATTYSGLGWHLAPTANNSMYDIYLRNLVNISIDGRIVTLYGQTTTSQFQPSPGFSKASASYIEIDKDFTNTRFGPYAPLDSLRITAAHEYHHAIQYGYNYYFDIWYAEATSTWMEDELYEDVNQSYSYIFDWFNNSRLKLDLDPQHEDTGHQGAGYGRWIFNRYLMERHDTPNPVLKVWQELAVLDPTTSPINTWGDIIMTRVLDSVLSTTYNSTLATDFFDFAKRVYMRDWPTTATITATDIGLIPNYLPIASYSTYPVNSASSSTPSVTLPHYSFAYYSFLPSPSSPNNLNITITGTSGIKATAFIKNINGIITEYPFSTVNSTTVTIPGFNSTSEAVLLVANITDVNDHQVSFSTDGITSGVTEPPTPTPATPAATSSGSSGGGGCFIATAAYGSYLHPQVQLLRNFRDEYLLTNAPGRAFVALYYRNSPPLADFIAHHPVLRSATRLALTPLVVAVAHPLISAVSLFLFFGALLMPLLRRIKAARSNAHPYGIRTT